MARQALSTIFGLLVKRYREEQGISQEVLAYKARVHRTYIGLVERGKRNPSLDVSHRLAQAVGVRLAALIAEAEEQFTSRGPR